jgi:hypothetical protein
MRFSCGPTLKSRWEFRQQVKHTRLQNWHKFFVVWPRNIGGVCVWLEFIERKGEFHTSYGGSWYYWDYRLP